MSRIDLDRLENGESPVAAPETAVDVEAIRSAVNAAQPTSADADPLPWDHWHWRTFADSTLRHHARGFMLALLAAIDRLTEELAAERANHGRTMLASQETVARMQGEIEVLRAQADGYCEQAHEVEARYERASEEKERLRAEVDAAGDLAHAMEAGIRAARERDALRAAVEEARGHLEAWQRAPGGSFEEDFAAERALAALSRVAPAEPKAPCPVHGFARTRCDCAAMGLLPAESAPTGSEAPVLEEPGKMALRLAMSMHPSTARAATRADMAAMGIRADREAIRRVLIAEAVSWPHANGRAALTHASCLLLGKEPPR